MSTPQNVPPKPHLELNEQTVKEINNGVSATLMNIFGVKPVPGAHKILTNHMVEGDVSGIVGIAQLEAEGTLVVSFPKETIFKLLEKMYKKPFTEVDKSVRDGVGELTNMIFGVFKTNLNRNGFAFQMAIPSVVAGGNHTITVGDEGQSLVIPYDSPQGSFVVQIRLNPDRLMKLKSA